MSKIRVAVAQIDTAVGDLTANLARITEWVNQARDRGADLVVFPQLALTGYPPGDLLLRPAFLDAAEAALNELSSLSRGITIVIGSVTTDSGIHNSAVTLRDGEVTGIHTRRDLSSLSYFDEPRYFEPGEADPVPIELSGKRVAVTIGGELRSDAEVMERLADRSISMILNLAAEPYQIGRPGAREDELRGLAKALGSPIIYANRVGGQDELVFYGESMVCDSSGEVIGKAPTFDEDLLIVELDLGSGTVAGAITPRARDDLAETYRALTIGIRDYARKNGFDQLLLGLSGGLDSALVATLAVDALGPEALTAVWMPSRYSSELSLSDAETLAQNLGIELITVPIEAAFTAYLDLLEPYLGGRGPDLTEENLQARIRGNILMALSNRFGSLVLVTSNKSETAVGYSTLYGDMAGGLAPLKDLYKTRVFELARWRNQSGDTLIPWSTIERPPTAELRADQLDTDSLPDYEILDPILEAYLVERLDTDRIVERGFDRALVERILNLIDHAEYKRRQAPPAIKVTSYTFGIDDRLPMTAKFRARLPAI